MAVVRISNGANGHVRKGFVQVCRPCRLRGVGLMRNHAQSHDFDPPFPSAPFEGVYGVYHVEKKWVGWLGERERERETDRATN